MSLEKIVINLTLLKNRIDSLDDKTVEVSRPGKLIGERELKEIEKKILKAIENKMRRP